MKRTISLLAALVFTMSLAHPASADGDLVLDVAWCHGVAREIMGMPDRYEWAEVFEAVRPTAPEVTAGEIAALHEEGRAEGDWMSEVQRSGGFPGPLGFVRLFRTDRFCTRTWSKATSALADR